MYKIYAVIENKKIVNVIVGVEEHVLSEFPDKYVECTNGWTGGKDIDTNEFFPQPIINAIKLKKLISPTESV